MAADPYKALGISRSATPEEIKKSYRALARKHHPDNNPDDPKAEDKFKEIQGAYDILSDPEKKQAFDRGGFNLPGGQNVPFDMGNLSDMLQDFLSGRRGGGGPSRPQAVRGNDLETQARITFAQSINGTEVSLPIPSQDPCPDCRGTGGKPGSAMRPCPDCSGQGVVMQSDGFFNSQVPCPRCHGAGRVPKDACPTCRGTGKRPGGTTLRVKIPAGMKDGGRIRVTGKGDAGAGGGPHGDLYVVVHVTPSRIFHRKGDNLEVELPITVSEALLGGEVRVPTLDGNKTLRLAPGTRHGTVQRLKGLGPPKSNGGPRGDLHYRIAIDVPKELSDEQRQLVEQLAALNGHNPRAELLEKATAAMGSNG
jgi:molecular chaperone DnaJ